MSSIIIYNILISSIDCTLRVSTRLHSYNNTIEVVRGGRTKGAICHFQRQRDDETRDVMETKGDNDASDMNKIWR